MLAPGAMVIGTGVVAGGRTLQADPPGSCSC